MLSYLVMFLLFKLNRQEKHSLMFISIIGAVSHNVGQLVAAAFMMKTLSIILYYSPFLILLAIPAGMAIGVVSKAVLHYLPESLTIEKSNNFSLNSFTKKSKDNHTNKKKNA